ncbi:MAG: class I SAM-dependent methyltransferase [Nanoarchaeota archaeon]
MEEETVLRIPQEVTRFVDTYWPLSPILQTIKEAVERKAQTEELIKLHEEYEAYLERKHGTEVLKRYHELCRAQLDCPNEETYKRIFGYTIASGLSEEQPSNTALRTRKTLESFLTLLSSAGPDLTVVDLGVGDGKLCIGYSLGTENVREVWGIDYLPEAIERAEINLRALPSEQEQTARKKMHLLEGDYRYGGDLENKLKEKGFKGADLCLIAYPEELFSAAHSARWFLKPKGGIIVYFPIDDDESPQTMISYSLNPQANRFGLSFRLFDERTFFRGLKLLGLSG